VGPLHFEFFMGHKPVLLREVIEYLDPRPGQKFIDATINGGGHAEAVAKRILPDGMLLGIDLDNELLKSLKFKIKNLKLSQNIVLVNDSYANLKKIAEENNFWGANGVLFDLGMSSWHLEESGRGFSFLKDEPLDMRYSDTNMRMHANDANRIRQLTAYEIVNKFSYDELIKILKEYGEERFARSIATALVKTRKEKPIGTTFQLVEIIKNSTPFWYRRRRVHFATKTFQALRIAVNNELENLKSGIEQAEEILGSKGRLAVISFHSLEDRIVKNFFRVMAKAGKLRVLTKKPVRPGLAEITVNPRARSAKLRVAAKA